MIPERLNQFTTWHDIPGQGRIQLVDVFGDERMIDRAARTTAGAETDEERTDEKRRGLMRYLMRHRHTTPLEFCEVVFLLEIPMDTWRQMVRHRTASINEYSTRYSPALDEMATVPPGQWRAQAASNRQGSAGLLTGTTEHGGTVEDVQDVLCQQEQWLHDSARVVYRSRLERGVAREQARKDLPLSTMTRAYWKIDLHNLLHFLGLRLDSHAQLEIRQYAQFMAEVVEAWVPNVWKAFVDYRLEAHTFSRQEMVALRVMVDRWAQEQVPDESYVVPHALQELEEAGSISKREGVAFLRAVGLLPDPS